MSITKNRIAAAAVSLMCMISLFAGFGSYSSHAAGDKSLTLICRNDDTTLVGMKWKIYRVGERQNGDFVLTGDFAKYPVSLGDMSVESVSTAAKTLESYAIADSIAPLAQGKTDKTGEKVFGSLDPGLYLASGRVLQIGDIYYVPSALLIEVGDEGAVFDYDAYPKYTYATLGGEVVAYTVRKVWVGDEAAAEDRPVDITVDLYKGEVLDDTVVLDESNNWQYRWVDLEDGYDWHVVERNIPVDYEVSIDFNETQYLIKNSYVGSKTTTTTTSLTTTGSGTTTSHGGGSTTVSSSGGTSTTYTSAVSTTVSGGTTPPATTSGNNGGGNGGGGGKIPQTGQLWWPVIPLTLGGLLLIAVGFMARPKRRSDEE